MTALFAASAHAAWAQAAPGTNAASPSEQQRTALYKEGFDAATAGRWITARDRFARALAIRPSAKVYFSLAQAEEQLGLLATASGDYLHALESAKAAGETEVVSATRRAIAALDPRVPRVRIATPGPGAVATLDGHPVETDRLVEVDPGAHRVEVTAGDARRGTVNVIARPGARLDVEVPLDVAAAETQAPLPEDKAHPLPWRSIALATAGVGVVAVGIGSYFGLEANSKNDASNSGGCMGNACTSSAAQLRRDALSDGNVSTALFVVGAAFLGGGAALWFLAPTDRGAPPPVTPVALTRGGGLTVRTSF